MAANLVQWFRPQNFCFYIINSLQWSYNAIDGVWITGVPIICSTICSGEDQRNHQSSAWLAFARGIYRWPVDSPHKGPVTERGKCFHLMTSSCIFKQLILPTTYQKTNSLSGFLWQTMMQTVNSHSRKSWGIAVKKWGKIGHYKIAFYISIMERHDVLHMALNFFSLMSKIKSVMLTLVRISCSWHQRLNDQSVHINETLKDYHCMILLPNQQYINRKCASTYSETVSVLNIWYISNTNNFSVCQCAVQMLPSYLQHFEKVYLLY